MAGSRALKNRIRATKNIRQITRAMEAVSAVKMRRSQGIALATRPYALTALSILHAIEKTNSSSELHSPLTEKRAVKNLCLVVITSDKGLAGAFNANVLRKAEQIVSKSDANVSIVAIGKKGRDYFARRHVPILKDFLGAGDFGVIDETEEITEFLMSLFLEKKCDEVKILYTNFLSALKQEVIERTLLPFSKESVESIIDSIIPLEGRYANIPRSMELAGAQSGVLKFEPSPAEVLGKLLPKFLGVQVYHAILEANASEHSSRMIAMKNASDSAGELVDTLNIRYNKSRQAAITKELAEITGGSEALAN